MKGAPIVFPVRFAAGERTAQATTRRLSRSGVEIRCSDPPEEGTRLQLKLYLPGAAAALEMSGLVVEVERGKEPAFWADFIAPAASQRDHIEAVINAKEGRTPTPPPSAPVPIGAIALQRPNGAKSPNGASRRQSPRAEASFPVRFANIQDFVLEYAANISAGGVFVKTDTPPELETPVEVVLELPDGGPPVSARGLVVHRVTPQEAAASSSLPGAGVQFVDASRELSARLEQTVAKILSARG